MRKKELLLVLGVVAWVGGCALVFIQLGRIYSLERKTSQIAAEVSEAKALAEKTERTVRAIQADVEALRSLTPTTAGEEPLNPFPDFSYPPGEDPYVRHVEDAIARVKRGLEYHKGERP